MVIYYDFPSCPLTPAFSNPRASAFSKTPQNSRDLLEHHFPWYIYVPKGFSASHPSKPLHHQARPGVAVTDLASPNPCPRNHQFPCHVFTRPITLTLFRCAVSPLRLWCFDSFDSAARVSQKSACTVGALGKHAATIGDLDAGCVDGFGRRVGSGVLETLCLK